MHIAPHHRFVRPRQRPDDDDEEEEEEEPVRTTLTRTRTQTSTQTRTTTTPTPTRSSTRRPASSSTRRVSSTRVRAASGTRTASSSSTATPTLPASSSEPESSSTRAIIGVGASVAAVVTLAVILWFVRKWYLKKHAARLGVWRASLHDQLDGKRNTILGGPAAAGEKDVASLRPLMSDEKGVDTPITPLMPTLPEPAGIPESLRPASVAPSVATAAAATKPATPPPTITSPTLVVPSLSVTSPTIAAQSPVTATPTTPAVGARREAAMVIRTFVPTLSDELPVTLGDVVFIIEAFTDGWASCTNSSGQNGVVPLECLQSMSRPQRNQALGDQQQDGSNWRTTQRHSSLYGGVRMSGTY